MRIGVELVFVRGGDDGYGDSLLILGGGGFNFLVFKKSFGLLIFEG